MRPLQPHAPKLAPVLKPRLPQPMPPHLLPLQKSPPPLTDARPPPLPLLPQPQPWPLKKALNPPQPPRRNARNLQMPLQKRKKFRKPKVRQVLRTRLPQLAPHQPLPPLPLKKDKAAPPAATPAPNRQQPDKQTAARPPLIPPPLLRLIPRPHTPRAPVPDKRKRLSQFNIAQNIQKHYCRPQNGRQTAYTEKSAGDTAKATAAYKGRPKGQTGRPEAQAGQTMPKTTPERRPTA